MMLDRSLGVIGSANTLFSALALASMPNIRFKSVRFAHSGRPRTAAAP